MRGSVLAGNVQGEWRVVSGWLPREQYTGVDIELIGLGCQSRLMSAMLGPGEFGSLYTGVVGAGSRVSHDRHGEAGYAPSS